MHLYARFMLMALMALSLALQPSRSFCAENAAQHQHAEGEAKHDESPAPAAVDSHAPAAAAESQADSHAGHNHASAEAPGGHADEIILKEEAIRLFNIRAEDVRPQALTHTIQVPARIEYNREAMAHVGTPLEGRVAEIRVRLGEAVKKGDVLAVIASPPFGEAQSDYLQKRSALEAARTALEAARIQFERADKLRAENGISVTDFLERQGAWKKAESEVKMDDSALRAAENKLYILGCGEERLKTLYETQEVDTSLELHAPIAGKIIQREITLGEIAHPEREALLVIADTAILWALADVPEIYSDKIQIGAQTAIMAEAVKDVKFPAAITHISPELDRQTRTLQVRMEIADGQTPLRPGMFAQAHLSLSGAASAKPVLAIPDSALLTIEALPSVFVEVKGEPGAFARRTVKTGEGNGVMLPVLEGLQEGERVVVQGAFLLKAELAKGEMEGKTCSGH